MPSIKVYDNFIRGTLTGAHSATGTTLTASGLTSLRTITSGLSYCTIIIDPLNANGNRESVRCSVHGAAAGTATITALANDHDDGEDYVVAFVAEDHKPSIDRIWGGDRSLDEEWLGEETSTVPTSPVAWAWRNQGTSTFLRRGGGASIKIPSTAGISFRIIEHSLSGYAATWEVTARLRWLTYSGANHNVGLQLIESSSGKFVSFHQLQSGAIYAEHYTNVTTYGGAYAGATTWNKMQDAYFRIRKNSSTSYDFEWSPDGRQYFVTDAARNPTAQLTPDTIGWGMSQTSKEAMLSCEFWRVR